MSAVTDRITVSSMEEAAKELKSRNFIMTLKRKDHTQWMNGGQNWATAELMPSGKVVIKIGVSTI